VFALGALVPLTVAFGFGWWNAPAAYLQSGWFVALSAVTLVVELTPPRFFLLVAPLGALAAAGLSQLATGPGPLRRALAVPESLLAIGGVMGVLGVLAVGAGLDRPTFWLGAILASIVAATSGPPQNRQLLPARPLSAAVGAAAILLAGRTLLEGPGMHSPAFALAPLWLSGPGANPAISGGVWSLAGLAALWLRRRDFDARMLGGVGVVAALGGLLAAWSAPSSPRAVADGLSAFGVLLAAPAMLLPLIRATAAHLPGHLLDPRHLLLRMLPLSAWAAVCAARGLTVFLWTVPGDLPVSVTQLSDRPSVFALAMDGEGGVWFSDRERREVGRWLRGEERSFSLSAGAPEEVGVVGETAWFSVAGPGGGALVPVTRDGPGRPLPVPGCWVSSWQRLPEPARLAASAPDGSVVLGCESSSMLWQLDPGQRLLERAIPAGAEVEEVAFGSDGALYAVSLWNGDRLRKLAWPSGEPEADRIVGPFSWSIQADDAANLVWVPRFFEGQALGLAVGSMELRRRIRLPFGVRVARIDEEARRLWVSGAYAGELVSIDLDEPSRRQRWALCGQGRALTLAPDGSALYATDCGVYRVAAE